MFFPHLTTPPREDPLDLYRLRDSLVAVDFLAAALVWLDFFSELDRAPGDLASICDRMQIHPRPTDVLMSLSKSLGLVIERNNVFEHLV